MIAANWKLHKSIGDVPAYFSEFKKLIDNKVPTLFFTSPVLLETASRLTESVSNISVGAQNISEHASGAYTGETSADQVLSVGAKWTLIGHSERRSVYGETDEQTHLKLKHADNCGLKVLLCVGETLAEREAGQTDAVIVRQLKAALGDLRPQTLAVAYEPVWAIGTGKVATVEQASLAHQTLKRELAALGLKSVPLLYGGSVKSSNALELLKDPFIDGLLVGGASLDASEFSKIYNAARETCLDTESH